MKLLYSGMYESDRLLPTTYIPEATKQLHPAEIWEQRQMTELIYKGLSKLPVKQRQRIYAHFFLGMSKADIAKAEGTHKSRITRSIEAGLRSLEKYFKEIL